MTDTNSSLLTLEPFVRHRAFTLWRLDPPDPDSKNPKPLKVPVHYDGKTKHSGPSPAPALTADQAAQWLSYHYSNGGGLHNRPGEVNYLGAGFRPSGAGLVCIDLDDCIVGGTWSAGALAIMGRFPGALIEQSVSGTGAHIWVTVSGEGPGRRGKKRTPFGDIEVYGDGQFLALGRALGGDASVDHTLAVAALVGEFWPIVDRADRADPLQLDADRLPGILADVRSAIGTLDPDDRDEWIACGQALACLGEEGYRVWAEWSATSTRFPGGDGLHKWEEFAGDRTDYRAILAKAQRGGWVNPASRAPLPSDAAAVFGVTPAVAVVSDLPPGAMLERPANRPDPAAAGSDLSFMAAAQGLIASTVASVETALLSPEAGVKIGYDTFKDRLSISVAGQAWRSFKDTDYGRLRAAFERRGFKPVPAEAMQTAVGMVAEANSFDSLKAWAEGLAWDGVTRIDRVLVDFYGVPDTSYARAVGAYLFTALAGRALVPGEKADMALILVGLQGARKTTALEVLAPEASAFGEVDLGKDDDVIARKLRGKCVIELAEMRGFKGRDADANKAWVSRRVEEWTPKYKEFTTNYPRRCVVIGTANDDEQLDDPTGARRFLPVHVGSVDIAGLAAARDQLWAEGVVRFKAAGVAWQDAERLAKAEHHKFEVQDSWFPIVAEFMDSYPVPRLGEEVPTWRRSERPIHAHDVLTTCLRINPGQIKRADEMRVAKIMRKLNYVNDPIWSNGRMVRMWVKRL